MPHKALVSALELHDQGYFGDELSPAGSTAAARHEPPYSCCKLMLTGTVTTASCRSPSDHFPRLACPDEFTLVITDLGRTTSPDCTQVRRLRSVVRRAENA